MADVTVDIVRRGNPAKDFNAALTFARNVWDMQAYGGKLYIGMGNSADGGTDIFMGPYPMLVYDPATDTFTEERADLFIVDQIDNFRVIDFGGSEGVQLVTPEHDHTGAGTALAFYALKSGTWRYHVATGSLGSPTHAYDCVAIGTHLIAGGGNIGYSMSLSSWNDSGGEAWTFTTGDTGISRGYSTFVLGGKGYIVGVFATDDSTKHLCEVNSGATAVTKLAPAFSTIFPSTSSGEVISDASPDEAVIRRPTNFGTSLVFVGAGTESDHQAHPFGLYSVDEVSSSGGLDSSTFARLTLPNSAIPHDLLLDGSTLYALGAHTSGSDTVVGVYSTTDLSSWTEEFTFVPNDVDTGTQGQTFARSFEKLDDIWYFGLGSNDSGTQPDNVGDVLSYSPVAMGVSMDWSQAAANPQRTAFQATEVLTPPFSLAWVFEHHRLSTHEQLFPQVQAIVSAGHVLVPTLSGNLRSFEAGPVGPNLEWLAEVGAPVMGSVAADGTNVYVTDTRGCLSAFKLTDGTAASGWTNPVQVADGIIQTSILLADGKLIIAGSGDRTLYACDPSDGSVIWSCPLGTSLCQTPAWSDAAGVGMVIVAGMDMKVRAIDSSDGSVIWTTDRLDGAAFNDYWPVVDEVRQVVMLRPHSRYQPVGMSGLPTLPKRGITVADWSNDGAMNTALANYDAKVALGTEKDFYEINFHVLDLETGAYLPPPIHWSDIVMHCAPCAPCIDSDGYAIAGGPVPAYYTAYYYTGFHRLDVTTRKVVDGLFDAADDTNLRNPDECMAVSSCATGTVAMHIQEHNSQESALFRYSDLTLHSVEMGPEVGATDGYMFVNSQTRGANPAAISGGMLYHLMHPHTLVAIQGS